MKKTLSITAALALALAPAAAITAPAHAENSGSAQIVVACHAGLAQALGVSIGTCVNLLRDADAVATCKLLNDANLLEIFGYRNQGQCIKASS